MSDNARIILSFVVIAVIMVGGGYLPKLLKWEAKDDRSKSRA